MSKFVPLNDQVIVKPASKEEVTKSGILIPDTAKGEKPQEGEVIAVGPGKLDEAGKRVTLQVKVGDKVLFSKYAPTEVKLEGTEYFFLREDEILAVIK